MKHLVILGAGTAGTMVANRMRARLAAEWKVIVVDPDPVHLYQPGLLFIPFGARDEAKSQRMRARTFAHGIDWVQNTVKAVDAERKTVEIEGGSDIHYDLLVIASGSHIRPEETPGLVDGGWRRNIFDFYTLDGARALRKALATFQEGRLVLNVVEMPIKCPVAPLEFMFLADAYFRDRGIRDRVELVLATPLDGAFTKKTCNDVLTPMLGRKGISVETEFNTGSVNADANKLVSYDERTIDYDLLVTIPTHMGAPFVEASDLGDDLGFIPTHPNTLLARDHDDIFVIGDATNLPSSKAGSVAHFQSEVLQHNLLHAVRGQSLEEGFDGHANCFIESGHGKALLIDFNYDVEPLPGTFPLPMVGPMALLKETRLNHFGKLAFRWLYWNMLLPGRDLPVPTRMSMMGKRRVEQAAVAAA